ncbi:putative phage-related protein [Candidatus Regiella insecticola 5.15]|uniref:Putative phage-related protein n=1 Tax=Candidatus Regiella insecticola 5.15 TaxID=1005043 RepID=G2H1K4_9ENTR|nr:DUF1799 domain-containing protein [Candidatus Regiella insecticola]EGY28125.1 putative phage-related protein [Candidatus Regiella insecticola 5.15]
MATALYTPAPSAEALACAGLRPEDFSPTPLEVWPELWPALQVMQAMSTQWRTGMTGPTGLDYGCLPQVMALLGVENNATVFDDIRHMERIALSLMHQRSST